MYMERKRQAEMAKRKGLTGRTLIQGFLMFLAALVAGGVVYWLEVSGTYSVNQLYALGVPRDVPPWALMIALGFIIMVIIQFAIAVGFVIGSPEGRRKQGVASAHTKTVDFRQSNDDY